MWYVEYLLLNREYIREKQDLDSVEYDDLLSVEIVLKNLICSGVISATELSVLSAKVSTEGLGIKNSKLYTGHPDTATKIFSSLCNKISTVLGGIFTDVGYAHYMQEKYDLSPDQVRVIESYMLSNFRHKILSKPYTEKES